MRLSMYVGRPVIVEMMIFYVMKLYSPFAKITNIRLLLASVAEAQ